MAAIFSHGTCIEFSPRPGKFIVTGDLDFLLAARTVGNRNAAQRGAALRAAPSFVARFCATVLSASKKSKFAVTTNMLVFFNACFLFWGSTFSIFQNLLQ